MLSSQAVRRSALALFIVCLATGCTKQQRALDAAKKDVLATGQPEEVIYVDHAGNTTVTMVSPPAPGTTIPTLTQTMTPTGATAVEGLPDWSAGQHPPARHVARYSAPGVLIEKPYVAAMESAVDPNASAYKGTVHDLSGSSAPLGSGSYAAQSPRTNVRHAVRSNRAADPR